MSYQPPVHRSMKGRRHRIEENILVPQRKARKGVQSMIERGYVKPLHEWDIEELARGKPRNRGGGFNGNAPKWLNEAIQEEIRRRFKQQAVTELVKYFPKALKVLVGLLEEEDATIRLKACQLLLDYTLGKPSTQVNVSTNAQAAGMLAAALVMPDGQPAHPIQTETIEGEVIDYE